MKLTQTLTQHKLRALALCPYWDVAKSLLEKLEVRTVSDLAPVHVAYLETLQTHLVKGDRLNPSHFFWDTLITDFKCPFIKRELLQINPAEVVYAWRWAEVIEARSTYNTGLIRRHLQTG
jgi:hypothetical protein